VPVINETFKNQLLCVKELILSEINVKDLETLTPESTVLTKKIKPNFKSIGPKYGKHMKSITSLIGGWSENEIKNVELNKGWKGELNGTKIILAEDDFEIQTADIPGFLVSSEGGITVALDIQISEKLKNEGVAREFINRIQNLRKDYGYNVTDRIDIRIKSNVKINSAINGNLNYICSETLADSLEIVNSISEKSVDLEINNDIHAEFSISKIN